MTELAKYDAARQALIEAESTDEVLEIQNQAIAWAAYARQAKDRELEVRAMHIRFRAVRRLGELLLAQRGTIGLNQGGGTGANAYRAARSETEQAAPETKDDRPPTLAEAGIDRKLSSQAQRMAGLPRERFEELLRKHQAEAAGGAPKVSADLMRVDSEDEGRAHRRNLAAELSGRTIALPTGRKYPCWYVDLPWRREGGVTGRSYENHYPTMAWPEILDFLCRARDLLLPDAWGFFWIPRAHLLAPVEINREVTVAATGEVVIIRDQVPLAWAVMLAADFDSYSTCFVWTKNDEEHPDEAGGAILARDQDELLLLFKRGRGLPKPAGSEKFGSNHRERSRLLGHSRKPEHYRHMIATMVGCDLAGEPLPVMEFFARVDAEHPLPKNWDAWGNQAAPAEAPIAAPVVLEEIAGEGNATPAPAAAAPAEGGAAAPIAEPLQISELEALQAIASFCHPRRAEICAAVAADYQAKGLAIQHGTSGEWILREAGQARLRELRPPPPLPADEDLEIPAFLRRRPPTARAQAELDLVRVDRKPPEIVDDKLQTRIPLEPDELVLHARLTRVDAGEQLAWHEMRDLCTLDYVHVPTEGKIRVSEAGRAFLAQLAVPADQVASGA